MLWLKSAKGSNSTCRDVITSDSIGGFFSTNVGGTSRPCHRGVDVEVQKASRWSIARLGAHAGWLANVAFAAYNADYLVI